VVLASVILELCYGAIAVAMAHLNLPHVAVPGNDHLHRVGSLLRGRRRWYKIINARCTQRRGRAAWFLGRRGTRGTLVGRWRSRPQHQKQTVVAIDPPETTPKKSA
jgi:hypothetical protein